MMPTIGITKFLYDIWCLNRALGNSTINSYQSFLLRNMIPTSGVKQLYYGNLSKKAAFCNSTKKYDAYKWH